MFVSLVTAIMGFLQGFFLLDAIKLTRRTARILGGKKIRELMDTERPPQGIGERAWDFLITVTSLTIALAVILLIPGFIWATVLSTLEVADGTRRLQSKIWAVAFLIGLFIVRVLIAKLRKWEL